MRTLSHCLMLALLIVTARPLEAGEACAQFIQHGRSDWRISLRPNASPPEALAARELAKYLRQISGAELATVRERWASKHTLRIDAAKGELDGFDLRVTPRRITIHGHTPRGALYGAYELLEQLGCRWYGPGQTGETIPSSTTLRLPTSRTTQTASFRERSVIVLDFDNLDETIDLLTKMRINNIYICANTPIPDLYKTWKPLRDQYLPLMQERQIILEWGGHHMAEMVPRELFASHPEYFRMTKDGKRSNDYNFCPSSGAIEVLKKNIAPVFAMLPEVTYFHLYANDLEGGGWCACPKCKNLSPADQNIIAMNAAAEVLEKINPKARLAVCSYHDYEDVPKIIPAPNLFLEHCPRERCYSHAYDDPQCRRNREEYLQRWLAIRAAFMKTAPDTIHEWNYYTDGILYRQMQPPLLETIPGDALFFRGLKLPVYQNLLLAYRKWHSPPLSLILSCRAAWNADVDAGKFLEDFCRHEYGEAQAAAMVRYYRQADQALSLFFMGDPIVGNYTDMRSPPLEPKMRQEVIARTRRAGELHAPLRGQLTQAMAAAPAGVFRTRIERERDIADLHDRVLALSACQYEGQFLATRYLEGKASETDARHALELMAEGIRQVDELNRWIERFPEEQKPLIPLWQYDWNGYRTFFNDLTINVKEKLARAKPPAQ